MKNWFFIGCLLAGLFSYSSCSDDDNTLLSPHGELSELTKQQQEAQTVMQQLWKSTPLQGQPLLQERQIALNQLQKLADKCNATYFLDYLTTMDDKAEAIEKHDVLLSCYRLAFDKVIQEIKEDKVENGTAHIWLLYNMGYIVKTPSGCFGIDLMHRWAEKLAPYLDFLCITHNHQDHYDKKLISSMLEAGKPVLSNFLKEGKEYTSTVPSTYTIKNFSIRTSITDHNNSGLSNFVTVFSIDCGADSGHFTLMHTGDSNYKAAQYTNILSEVDVLIPRYAPNALTENNIIGTKKGQTQPSYVLLSHILELTHVSEEESRWSIPSALERASKINCNQTYVPMWGEKMIWKNNKLN